MVTINSVSTKLVFEGKRKDGSGSFCRVYIPNYGNFFVDPKDVLPVRDNAGREIRGRVNIVLGEKGSKRKVNVPNPNGGYTYIHQPVEHIAKVWTLNQQRYIEKQRRANHAKTA